MTRLLEQYRSTYSATADEEIGLEDYLALCKKDPTVYASAAERMLAAIGEAEMFDTRNDPRLSRIFSNRVIRRYPAFREFFGMEDAIDQIVAFFRHAAQGSRRAQADSLLAGAGRGRQVLDRRAAEGVDGMRPIYVLKGSPVNELPLGLFSPAEVRRDAGR
jgi:serine protein kinase